MADQVQIGENLIEIRTLTDEEVVLNWASQQKISPDAVEKLFKDGFTSMEAIKLLDIHDLGKTKIPRGQQKLILASVRKLLSLDERAEQPAPAQHIVEQPAPAQFIAGDVTSEEAPTATHAANQSRTAGNPTLFQDGGAQSAAQNTTDNNINTDAFNLLLNNLQTGQSAARNTITVNDQCTPRNESGFPVLGLVNGPNSLSLNQSSTANTISQSWRDPQIFLETAASGKSVPTHYDITDFICNTIEEEIVVGGNGSQQVVVKSGPRKPKLENVTLSQWSVANLAILYRLVAESKLHAGNILDYLSYTTKICQLVQRYTLVSVLMYDREYRQLQARHSFRWGTDVPHFHTIHLQPRVSRPAPQMGGKTAMGTHKSATPAAPLTLDGKIICKLFNTRAGCPYKECRYVHQCSHAGCHQYHSAQTHGHSKN